MDHRLHCMKRKKQKICQSKYKLRKIRSFSYQFEMTESIICYSQKVHFRLEFNGESRAAICGDFEV